VARACLARAGRGNIARPNFLPAAKVLLNNIPSPPLHALFLGTADGCSSSSRDHSGVLLQAQNASLLLDCGAAAERHLVAGKLAAEVPGAIWLSHMHSDHIGQVGMLIQALWLRRRRAPLHVFGPQAVVETMRDWLARCLLFPELIGFPIEWHAVRPGEPVTYGPFTLTAFATEHLSGLAGQFRTAYPATSFECYGAAIDFHDRRYVYSADLAHPREMEPALTGRKVTALICELAHFPERELFGELARHQVESLWITHYGDTWTGREKELAMTAREEKFNGTVHLLQDKVAIEI
jgi:ribonuclease BN (tRNA processing enzyme)